MLHLAMTMLFLLTAGLVFYKVVTAIVANWQQVAGSLLILLILAVCGTTFLIYIDEYVGFRNKMRQATDWIAAGIYTVILFTIFSGIFFIYRKKNAS